VSRDEPFVPFPCYGASVVADHYESFLKELSPLIASGKIRYREDITEGLAATPEAFIGMLAGRNFGKTLVRVSS
jgi:NADPH-dependent curcumin reductase CurA